MYDQIWNYVIEQLHSNQFFSATALFSFLASVGYSLRSVPLSLYNRLHRLISFDCTIEHDDKMFDYLNTYLQDKHSSTFRKVELSSALDAPDKDPNAFYSKRSLKEISTISNFNFSHENDWIYLWHKKRRLRISKTKSKLESAHDVFNMFQRTYSISGLFAKSAILDFLTMARDYATKEEKRKREEAKKISLYTHNFYGNFSSSKTLDGKEFDSLFFKQKSTLLNDLDSFKKSKETYEKLKVPFKRGYLFYGLPGNGKSSIAFAMANYLKYDVYLLNPTALSPEYFLNAITNIPPSSIILIEDIDAFYAGRKAVKENKISFSLFINALSGIDAKENIITIFTTNHIDSLDPALIRDGRCDFKLELTNPCADTINEYLNSVLPDAALVISPKMKENKSFASIQNIVLKNINNIDIIKQQIES